MGELRINKIRELEYYWANNSHKLAEVIKSLSREEIEEKIEEYEKLKRFLVNDEDNPFHAYFKYGRFDDELGIYPNSEYKEPETWQIIEFPGLLAAYKALKKEKIRRMTNPNNPPKEVR